MMDTWRNATAPGRRAWPMVRAVTGSHGQAPPVVQRLARDAGIRALGGQQQPAHHVSRETEAAQCGHHERDPDDRNVDARPRRQAGREPGDQAVLPRAPQRPAAAGPAHPLAAPAPPRTPVRPAVLRARAVGAGPWLPVTALAIGQARRPGAVAFLHVSIIAPRTRLPPSGRTLIRPVATPGSNRGSSRYPRRARRSTLVAWTQPR